MAGTEILEIDATLLTVRPLGECRVWSEYLGQTYVRKRCTAELRFSPYLTYNFDGRLRRKLAGSSRLEAGAEVCDLLAS